jgi:anti-sigma regulatory factor (Ser/Thr protein kinase)
MSGRDIVLVYEDDAGEFDPTRAEDPVLPRAIEDAKIGGLGLMLVRKVASGMQYKRENGRNTLRVDVAA